MLHKIINRMKIEKKIIYNSLKYRNNDFPLYIHFGYHKCMTVFFSKVLWQMSLSIGKRFKRVSSDLQEFRDCLRTKKYGCFNINNVLVNLEKLPHFLGSHIVRDPRDLLVSGYRYHKWCNEKWVIMNMSEIPIKVFRRCPLEVNFSDILNKIGIEKKYLNKSYKELLNHVDEETGYMLEMEIRKPSFSQMYKWNYNLPNIYELRYEDVFGNEQEAFKELFSFFGIPKNEISNLMNFVYKNSFKQIKKEKNFFKEHASVGISNQWKSEMPKAIQKEILFRYFDLLKNLGYEYSDNF